MVIVVDAEESTRIGRVQARSGLAPAEISKRLAFQLTDTQRRELADLVLDNNADPETLQQAARELWTQLQDRAAGGGPMPGEHIEPER